MQKLSGVHGTAGERTRWISRVGAVGERFLCEDGIVNGLSFGKTSALIVRASVFFTLQRIEL